MIKDFRDFAFQGNVMDLAVGIVIGAAFKGIVDSFVADILSPILGLLTGGYDFANHFIVLGAGHYDTLAQAKAAGVATLNYGLFINAVLNFLIVALALYIIVKRLLRLRARTAG